MVCAANYPNHGEDLKAKSILWMQTFQGKDDGLMETAIISCLNYCKKFPTIADIREAINLLHYEETTKPKQIGYEVKYDSNVAKRALQFARDGKAKEYMQSLDITELIVYAKQSFPDISPELVLRNYIEFMQGKEKEDQCFACRMQKQACEGWKFKHYLDFKTGYVKNEMLKCDKQVRS